MEKDVKTKTLVSDVLTRDNLLDCRYALLKTIIMLSNNESGWRFDCELCHTYDRINSLIDDPDAWR